MSLLKLKQTGMQVLQQALQHEHAPNTTPPNHAQRAAARQDGNSNCPLFSDKTNAMYPEDCMHS